MRRLFPLAMAAVAGAAAMTVAVAAAQGGFDRRGGAPEPAQSVQIFEGVSERGMFQEALDRAVSDALRSLPGADRMVQYRVREITGEQGGIRGGNTLRVTIEVPSEEGRPIRPGRRPGVQDDRGRADRLLDVEPVLRVRPEEVRRGDTASFELTVRNVGDEEVRIPFNSGQQFDFEVLRDGRSIWRWSQGRVFTQATSALALGPGQSITFTGRWDLRNNAGARVPPGEYEVRASLPTNAGDGPIEDRAPLVVTE